MEQFFLKLSIKKIFKKIMTDLEIVHFIGGG